jgi:C1A family cysteine protease
MLSLIAFAVLTLVAQAKCPHPSFEAWEMKHGKDYTPTERDYRMTVYGQNLEKIKAHNAGNATWSMAVNKFADLTAEEFGSRYTGGFRTRTRMPFGLRFRRVTTLPASVDWASEGAVTPVKNQGQCGSCWSFSTTGAVEGAWFLANHTLVPLSEQQLIDCSTAEGNQGCNGGLMDYAFQYIIDNKGITSEQDYPYSATGPNACKAKGKPVVAKISGFKDVQTNSDNALMTALAQQPVSVAVEADQNAFQFYSSGVMTAACGTSLDHGVLAVGYGALNGQDYYLVKNSWGADWGAKGYIYLGRGAKYNGGAGQCGILMDPSYPLV